MFLFPCHFFIKTRIWIQACLIPQIHVYNQYASGNFEGKCLPKSSIVTESFRVFSFCLLSGFNLCVFVHVNLHNYETQLWTYFPPFLLTLYHIPVPMVPFSLPIIFNRFIMFLLVNATQFIRLVPCSWKFRFWYLWYCWYSIPTHSGFQIYVHIFSFFWIEMELLSLAIWTFFLWTFLWLLICIYQMPSQHSSINWHHCHW